MQLWRGGGKLKVHLTDGPGPSCPNPRGPSCQYTKNYDMYNDGEILYQKRCKC